MDYYGIYRVQDTAALSHHDHGMCLGKVVFGRYLFAKAFFWEDVFSMLVLALHTAYLLALTNAWLATHALMVLALGAYLAYVINAAQFLLKLRAARRQQARAEIRGSPVGGVAYE